MKCCEQVPMKGMAIYRTRSCVNEAKVERNGCAYCGIHDPVAKAERAAKLAPKKAKTEANRRAMYNSYLRHRGQRIALG